MVNVRSIVSKHNTVNVESMAYAASIIMSVTETIPFQSFHIWAFREIKPRK